VPAGTVEELESLGDDGAAAADLATGTSPDDSQPAASGSTSTGSNGSGSGSQAGSGSGSGSGSQAGSGAGSAGSGGGSASATGGDESGSGTGVGKLIDSTVGGSDSGGMGPALPLILLATAVAAIAFFVVRRQRTQDPHTP
jgi:hypothetical protein